MKCRTKPVLVDAFCLKNALPGTHVKVQTLRGEVTAGCGDWIVCHRNGQISVCDQDSFRLQYEEVVDARD